MRSKLLLSLPLVLGLSACQTLDAFVNRVQDFFDSEGATLRANLEAEAACVAAKGEFVLTEEGPVCTAKPFNEPEVVNKK